MRSKLSRILSVVVATLLATLSLPSIVVAQGTRGAILPTDEVTWGSWPEFQRLTVFDPPNWDGENVILYFVHGGFRTQRPRAKLNATLGHETWRFVDLMLTRFWEKGVAIVTSGCVGAAEDSDPFVLPPPSNHGGGFFREVGDPLWEDEQAAWTYKDAVRTAEIVADLFSGCSVGYYGKSAGAMAATYGPTIAALRPAWIVALELPISWPALRQDQQQTIRSYFRREGTFEEPAVELGEASEAEQVGASIFVVPSGGIPTFFATGWKATPPGIVDSNPITGVRDSQGDVHSYGSLVGFWIERKVLGLDDPVDELWVMDHASLGHEDEQEWPDDFERRAFGPTIVLEQERWMKDRMGIE